MGARETKLVTVKETYLRMGLLVESNVLQIDRQRNPHPIEIVPDLRGPRGRELLVPPEATDDEFREAVAIFSGESSLQGAADRFQALPSGIQKVDAVDLLQVRIERAATLDDELLPLAGDVPRTARDKLRSLLSFRRVGAVS